MRTESAAPPLVFQFVGTAQVSAPEHDDARDHAEDKRGSRVHSGTSSADSTAEPPVSIPTSERDAAEPTHVDLRDVLYVAPRPVNRVTVERDGYGLLVFTDEKSRTLQQDGRHQFVVGAFPPLVGSIEPLNQGQRSLSSPHGEILTQPDAPQVIPFRRPGLTGLAGADWLRDRQPLTPRRRRRPFPYRMPYGGEVR
jgi:hypothetical protein